MAWLAAGVVRVILIGRRCNRAVQHLPGPKFSSAVGIFQLLASRKDLHRMVTEWVEQHGPLLQLSAGCQQVRLLLCCHGAALHSGQTRTRAGRRNAC